MGFFSGLISFLGFILLIVFVFAAGVIAGMILYQYILEKFYPKTEAVMREEALEVKNRKNVMSLTEEEDSF